MAITASQLLGTPFADTAQATVYGPTASVTSTTGALLLVTVVTADSVAPEIPALTGLSLTWVRIGGIEFESAAKRVDVFRAMGTGASGGLTATYGTNQTGVIIPAVHQFTGVDQGGTNGSAAVLQPTTGTAFAASITITLPNGFGHADNATYGGFGLDTDIAIDAGSGFTMTTHTGVTPVMAAGAEYKLSNDNSVDASKVGADRTFGGLALEIKALTGTVFTIGVAGSITPSGLVFNKSKKTLLSSSTPSGLLYKKITKIFLGSVSSSGLLIQKIKKAFISSTTPAGVLRQMVKKIFAGSITPAGVFSYLGAKKVGISGSVTPVGLLYEKIKRLVAGTVTPSGAYSNKFVATKLVTGLVTPVGTLFKKTKKVLLATISPQGLLITRINKRLAGTVTPVGSITKKIRRLFIAGVSITGQLWKYITLKFLFHRKFEFKLDSNSGNFELDQTQAKFLLDESGSYIDEI